jgi:integrase
MGKRRGKGEGSIRQRKDGRWEGSVTTGTTANGNPKRQFVYGKTRAEVAKRLNELLDRQHKGLLTDPNKTTVAEWLERWLENKTHLTEKSRNNYRQETSPIINMLGKLRLQDLRPAQIQDLYNSLASTPRKQRKAATHLKGALKDAVELQIIVRNPAEAVKVKAPRTEKGIKAWSREETAEFLRAARGEIARKPTGGKRAKGQPVEIIAVDPDNAEAVAYYPIFYLMLMTGLRRGEALGLSWNNVDFAEGTVRVTQTLSMVGEGSKTVLKEVKTPHSRRTIYVGHDVMTVLREHKAKQDAERLLMGSDWQDGHNLVFTTPLGTPVGPRNLDRSFKGLALNASVKPINLHGLRHTHASLALQRGVPVEVLSKRLGHARVDITLNLYRHVYDIEMREAALTFDDLIGRPRALN